MRFHKAASILPFILVAAKSLTFKDACRNRADIPHARTGL